MTPLRVAIGGCLVALLAACGSPAPTPVPSPTPTTAAPTGDGVLRIGTLFPTSGDFSFIAAAQAAGVNLAVAEINAAGGVNGAPVEVLARDSGAASTGTAEASFADLVANGADVVVGPSSSALAQRLIPLSIAAKVPLISPAATFPALPQSEAGYFFRTIPSYPTQGRVLGTVLSAAGPVKVAFVYLNDALGQALVPELTDSVAAAGSTLVLSEGVDPATTDFAPVVANLVAAAPDVVVLGSAYTSLDATKAMITQVIAAGFGGAKLWLTTQNTGDYSQAFPGGTLAAVNGLIEGVQPDEAFTARLKGVDGGLTDLRYSVEAYDATIVAALAAITSGDDSGPAVAGAMRSASSGGIKCTSFAECLAVLKTQPDIDYDGISGPLDFTDTGDVSSVYYGVYAYDAENHFVFQRGVIDYR